MRTNAARRIVGLATALLGLGVASPAAAVVCGETIGPNVSVTLSGTLVCDDVSHGLTIVGPARVTFAGLLIVCQDLNQNGAVPSSGLRVLGRNVRVQGTPDAGGATAFCRTGVEVAGEGRHRIAQMITVDGARTGFSVTTDANVLKDNEASGMTVGFEVSGENNDLRNNLAEESRSNGFNVFGDRTRLTGNRSTGNDFGFYLRGGRHRVRKNQATGNGRGFFANGVTSSAFRGNVASYNSQTGIDIVGGQNQIWVGNEARSNGIGIYVDASSIRVIANEAIGNIGDLVNRALDCGTNVWRNNVFGTANRSCIR